MSFFIELKLMARPLQENNYVNYYNNTIPMIPDKFLPTGILRKDKPRASNFKRDGVFEGKLCARSGTRTHKVITPTASETATFANFAIRAIQFSVYGLRFTVR